MKNRPITLISIFLLSILTTKTYADSFADELEKHAADVEQKVIKWRRDIHQHPELGNREFRTAKLVAQHLRELGIEVQEKVAHTGVVGVLRGGKPGSVVALRADMDALPVKEQTDVPFASKVTTVYNGIETGVMHACGHDAHTAILMGTAEVLSAIRAELPGTVKFIFQPAEEGPPPGEEGGAKLMVKEGVLEGKDAPQAIFGLHVWTGEAGTVSVRPGGIMASSDQFKITVNGSQTHGAQPWKGVDPIVVASQITTALQTIVSRQLDLTLSPAVISIGRLHSGIRYNIIPNQAVMAGTIRTFDTTMHREIWERIRNTAENVAASAGATAEVEIKNYAPVTYNNPELLDSMRPTLLRVAGKDKLKVAKPVTPAEDFSYFSQRIPGLFLFLGINKEGVAPNQAAPNHSPFFYVNEDALLTGVRTMSALTVDYLLMNKEKQ